MAEMIKPCPFCGGEATLHPVRVAIGPFVSCATCGLEGPTETGVTEQDAILHWNTRPLDPVTDNFVKSVAWLLCNDPSLRITLAQLEHIERAVRNALQTALSQLTAPKPVTGLGDLSPFKLGERVTKTKGSSWTGKVVGYYSTELTPVGCAVESENEPGSVQIYPASALEVYHD